MSSVTELWQTWQEGFANKDSSKLAEFLTDDFEMVGASGTRSRQQTLDWTAAGGSPSAIDNLEVLFENDDVAVYINTVSAVTGEQGDGVAMCFYTKRGDKFSHQRFVRQVV
ncbi:uncharacterized protein METZ01_LOCUS502120 [marine metagenome]|uniref:DUF4440 domain-containing protein n=1 Tax=marine metagenome TaxID=408172 RepID=A0A383DXK3_9ZZZZ